MEDTKKPALYLVDGSNYLFRAFYAIRELSNSRGFPTNAIYGFTTMLLKLLRENNPEYIAVAFDVKGPTFRHDAYEGYKATRKAIPEAIVPQIPFVKEVVRAYGIPVIEQPGIEADDVIGTLATTYAGRGMDVVIVSGDKDLLQLVSEHVTLVDTMKDKRYDVSAVKERFGVMPSQIVDLLALAGDASDNIPGVPGIGPKGAERLIQEFGSVENVLNNISKIKNGRAKAAIEAHADSARVSRVLAQIRLDAVFPFDIEDCRRKAPDQDALRRLFREFEFASLLQDLKSDGSGAINGDYCLITDEASLMACLATIREHRELTMELVLANREPMRAQILGLALCISSGKAFYIPLLSGGGQHGQDLNPDDAWRLLTPVFSDASIAKDGHDLKTILVALDRKGVVLRGLRRDTMLMAYCLNPSRRGFDLADISRDYTGCIVPSLKEISPTEMGKTTTMDMVPPILMATYACGYADAVCCLAEHLDTLLVKDGLDGLYRDLEMPLVPVLAGMESHGVLLDLQLLKDMSQELKQLMDMSVEKIYRLAGERFNINSPKQLQEVLFDRLRLPKGRKTKEGYSTDVDVLTQLAKSHELPGEILAYRSLAKLKSTYIDALPLLVHEGTGRVHTSYNQAVTATGRLSSSNPNLQNIPVRTLEGKRIRQAFVASTGFCLVSADYSQIELRVLAHLSEDKTLLAFFASGEDIHSRTASTIFGVFPEMVNDAMRRQAKVINFGVLYGMSAFGLAKELDIPQKLAQAYIDEYFRKYDGVRDYLKSVLTRARQDGFVTTLLNRRRYLPDIHSENLNVRQYAERMAVNMPVQGTAADLIKMAMIHIDRRLREEKFRTRMIMQVHDELVFEAPEVEREEVMGLVREEMENVAVLRVPLKVEIDCGRNWDEDHR
ncbi:MAG: DNA polymerase I [Syntrophus sp. SKADARSKE-3]|nr:DNA polymerase I [Syntrophus sp. SKADARSKE-3]